MKRYLACLLLALCLTGCSGGTQTIDYGAEGAAIADGTQPLTHTDSFNLSESDLTTTAEDLEGRLLYTNSTKITVKASGELSEGCMVYLCGDGEDLMEFMLKGGRRTNTFTNLTAARDYTLRMEDAAGVTFTVTD